MNRPEPWLLNTQLLLWWAAQPERLPQSLLSGLAVAQVEGLTLLTADGSLSRYGPGIRSVP